MSLLAVENLSKRFGGYQAVADFSFHLRERELLGLIGPNGAGKTTIFNMITGFLRPTAGKILYRGKDITGLSPHRRAWEGIVRTYQKTSLFAGMTVEENLRIASYKREKGGLRRMLLGVPAQESAAVDEAVDEALTLVGLGDKRAMVAEDLPYGDQRVLEIAIALAAQPRLLLLDEPVAGMNPTETNTCMELIRTIIGKKGIAVLLVEHDMRAVMANCDRIVVVDYGSKLAEGEAAEIQKNPKVIQAYLGSSEPFAD